jgi:hypothetical protein
MDIPKIINVEFILQLPNNKRNGFSVATASNGILTCIFVFRSEH